MRPHRRMVTIVNLTISLLNCTNIAILHVDTYYYIKGFKTLAVINCLSLLKKLYNMIHKN